MISHRIMIVDCRKKNWHHLNCKMMLILLVYVLKLQLYMAATTEHPMKNTSTQIASGQSNLRNFQETSQTLIISSDSDSKNKNYRLIKRHGSYLNDLGE